MARVIAPPCQRQDRPGLRGHRELFAVHPQIDLVIGVSDAIALGALRYLRQSPTRGAGRRFSARCPKRAGACRAVSRRRSTDLRIEKQVPWASSMLRGACAATNPAGYLLLEADLLVGPGRNPESRRFPDAALAGYHPHSACPRASRALQMPSIQRDFSSSRGQFLLAFRPARTSIWWWIRCPLQAAIAAGALDGRTRLLLGGGSNLIFGGDFHGLVLKVAIEGRRLVHEDADAW